MENQVKAVSNHQQNVQRLTQKMLDTTAQSKLFSEPVNVGDYTLITASEMGTALGTGTAFGLDGGGGTATGRSVAVISIGPKGVQVKPVIDFTKIGLALLTTIGSIVLMLSKLRRVAK